jgi:hypothetical protein
MNIKFRTRNLELTGQLGLTETPGVFQLNPDQLAATREIEISGKSGGKFSQAGVMLLTAPENDVARKTGVTLGGAEIKDDASWNGKWTPVAVEAGGKQIKITIQPASAAIVKCLLKE